LAAWQRQAASGKRRSGERPPVGRRRQQQTMAAVRRNTKLPDLPALSLVVRGQIWVLAEPQGAPIFGLLYLRAAVAKLTDQLGEADKLRQRRSHVDA